MLFRIAAMGKYFLFCILCVLSSEAVFAQSNERVYEELDFRFVTPGARATAMGKTFVGLADDATAAYTNPAGLSNLLEQELSFEAITTQIDHHRFIPSENGETQVFGDRVFAPSFFSYALPRKSFTFSFFRNVVQDHEEDFQWAPRFIPSINETENGYSGSLSVDAENYGLGASYLINPQISIGGTLTVSRIDANISGRTGRVGVRNGTDTIDADTALGAILGLLVKPNKKWSIGAVYNTGSKFELVTKAFGRFTTGTDVVDLSGNYSIDYVIPNRLSVGSSYRWNERFTVAFDLSRIFYSQLITENFLILDFRDTSTVKNYFIEDVFEGHFGAEYRLYYRNRVIAFRAGMYTDPDHQLHFRATPGQDQRTVNVLSFRFNSLEQKTDLGVTFGAGIALANRVQIDSAFSFSRDSDDFVLSFVLKL